MGLGYIGQTNRRHLSGKPCHYCRREMNVRSEGMKPTRDHVVPKSRGGRTTVWCCQTCNNIKADMMPADWQRFMADNPEWWRKHGHYARREMVRREFNRHAFYWETTGPREGTRYAWMACYWPIGKDSGMVYIGWADEKAEAQRIAVNLAMREQASWMKVRMDALIPAP